MTSQYFEETEKQGNVVGAVNADQIGWRSTSKHFISCLETGDPMDKS